MRIIRRKNARSQRIGMTLLELTIVIFVLSVMTAIGAIRYVSALETFRVQRSAERIAADIDAARQAARSRNQAITIAFNIGTQSYSISGLVNPDQRSAGFTAVPNDNVLATQILSANFGGDANLQFNNFGFPDSGGLVTLRSGAAQQTVTIAAGTGAVSIP
jgi:Tfp pilus assembly protein FimT